MNARHAAEVILSARKAAQRVGGTYIPDRNRLNNLGYNDKMIDEIAEAVAAIEQFTETRLRCLEKITAPSNKTAE